MLKFDPPDLLPSTVNLVGPAGAYDLVTSYSDLGTYSNCPRAWFLGSYLGLHRIDEPPTGALPFGSRIHRALELWGIHCAQKLWGLNHDEPDLIKIWNELMAPLYAAHAQKGWDEASLDKEAKLGAVMLEGYLEWLENSNEAAEFDVVDVEYRAATAIPVGYDNSAVLLLRGMLDRRLVHRQTGFIYSGDYKTVGAINESTLANLARSPQQRIYLLLERSNPDNNAPAVGFVLTLLRKVLRTSSANPPFYQHMRRQVRNADLNATWVNVKAQASRMLVTKKMLDTGHPHERIAPYHPTWQCNSCPFRMPCQEWQDGNKAGGEAMLQDLYTQGDPFARYLASADTEVVEG